MSFSSQIKLLFLLFLSIMVSCSALSQKGFHGKGLITDLDRPYKNAPPLVPHDIVELEINRSANDCLDCHFGGLEIEHGHIVATKAPPSHYINEFSKVQTKEQIIGIRYNCLQCHVPQSEEEPLVSQMKLD